MRRGLRRGATLVEVLVAISVIGALAAIGIPQYAGYTERGREAQCVANRHNVETAARACAAETGRPCLSEQELHESGYLSGMPDCPSGGSYVWLNDDPSDPASPKMGCSKHFWNPAEERHAKSDPQPSDDGGGGGGGGGGGDPKDDGGPKKGDAGDADKTGNDGKGNDKTADAGNDKGVGNDGDKTGNNGKGNDNGKGGGNDKGGGDKTGNNGKGNDNGKGGGNGKK